MPAPIDNTASPFLLEGLRCVVTGAASGIGMAMARALLDHGAEVLLVDRDNAALATVLDATPPARTAAPATSRTRRASSDWWTASAPSTRCSPTPA